MTAPGLVNDESDLDVDGIGRPERSGAALVAADNAGAHAPIPLLRSRSSAAELMIWWEIKIAESRSFQSPL